MKAEINNENKGKFFALYWGQRNQYCKGQEKFSSFEVNPKYKENWYLELIPLSSISDEDAIKVAEIYADGLRGNYNRMDAILEGTIIAKQLSGQIKTSRWNMQHIIYCVDFLRSCGYALPWMELTVDEMVKAGWIKLTSL